MFISIMAVGWRQMHFRNDHVLCEHPDCLAKKFVVFASQVEIKVGFILTDSMPSFHSVTDIIIVHFVVTCQTV
jgi:predicted RNA binding protein YcfA (HicA-like mRNA interferase family)